MLFVTVRLVVFQVLPEKRANVGAAMMGSAHGYDVAGAKKLTAEGIEVSPCNL